MRAWANADITVRRAAIELLFWDTTRVPARPTLAMPRTASAIETSMSVMPRGVRWDLVFKTAPPEEPAEQARGGRTAAVHRGSVQRPARRFIELEYALVGDDDELTCGDVEHRSTARAADLGQSELRHVVVERARGG